jgi:hypothetical protein
LFQSSYILAGGGVMTAIRFQDAIFGSIVMLIGLGLIAVGVYWLVQFGGVAGAIGIFMSLLGCLLVWFGQAIIRDSL